MERHKSGFTPPGDIPFEDLSNANIPENHNSNTPKNSSLQRDTVKGTMSGGKNKKRGGLFGIFGSSKVSCHGDESGTTAHGTVTLDIRIVVHSPTHGGCFCVHMFYAQSTCVGRSFLDVHIGFGSISLCCCCCLWL